VTIARISRWPRVRSALLLPAFDAEHIAAIDNSTRKLMNDGQRPLSVGLLVALGHSTIVFALCVLVAWASAVWAARSRTGARFCTRPAAWSAPCCRARSCS
jgi:hypothetical protein